jgi:cytochrome P450
VLLSRGWSEQRIAAEVVMLTFAGWASLAAAVLSGTTLGVTREAATPQGITELLRVAPPGWLVVREATASVELPGLPMPIPAGELILLSPWFLGRSDKGWPKATCFDDARSGTRRSPWYLPFSSGSRACPAEAFSRAFLEIALGSLPSGYPSEEIRAVLVEGRSACLVPAFEGTGK